MSIAFKQNPDVFSLRAVAAAFGNEAVVVFVADDKLDKNAALKLVFPDGEELTGQATIMRYIARASNTADSSRLLGDSPLASCQVDSWIDFAATQLVGGAGLEGACTSLNNYLSARTHIIGHTLTLADIACWAQLQSTMQWLKIRKSGNVPHVVRWFDFITSTPILKTTAEKYGPPSRKAPTAVDGGATTKTKDGKKPKETGSFDIGLKNAEMGKVVTRFPPEPSGYLHVGHAKAALLNQYISDMYKGKMLVRFDDTNPSKEKDEYVDNIIADMDRLGLRFEKITHTSDYFPQLFECAERLIAQGHIYADDTPVEEMREQRMAGVANNCRSRTPEENLRIWKEMKEGTEEGKKNCMRLKLDIAAGNTALRDPVAFRCNDNHHWRTGHTYKCYPTYDFACPFVDSYEGVTHALRTSEYKDREAQFYWVLKLQQGVWPGLPDVFIWDYARLSFIFTVLSKRKLTWFVDQGIVESWDDPRMPTVQGLLRRGLLLEAMKEYIISQGASKNVTYQEWDKIWTINKKLIDPACGRHTALDTANLASVTLSNGPNPPESVTVPRHLKNPAAGTKTQLRTTTLWLDQADATLLTDNEEVTLMAWGNCIMNTVHRNPEGIVTNIDATLHLEGDFKKTKLKLTWLAQSDECPKLELHHFGHLLTKRKLEEEDNFEDYVNKESRTVYHAIGDVNMKVLPRGEVIQLERRGYYIVDVAYDGAQPDKAMVLFNIPDGRMAKDGQ